MSSPTWTVELHAHTIYSKDCLTRLEKLRALCQIRGIDKLAITDHNTAKAALEMARLYPMWVIPGEEIMTTQGEILGWYIQDEVPAGLSPAETISRLRSQGAVIGVPHPFDRYRRGAWRLEDLLGIVDHIDALEVFNARCIHNEDNDKAVSFAGERGTLMTCGSDAHIPAEYGRSVMKMAPFANTAEGFKAALMTATRQEVLSSRYVHLGSTYAKWIKRVFPGLRPA
jgi:predicted metal-dependent phosphoesterase TrpH